MAEETIPVGYQGVPGAYSHLALRTYFAGKPMDARNFMLFEDVIQAVMEGKVRYGVLPIENSSTGGITDVYDLVRRYGASIVGEKIVKVEHCLLACPGAKLEGITEVYSIPRGFPSARCSSRNTLPCGSSIISIRPKRQNWWPRKKIPIWRQ